MIVLEGAKRVGLGEEKRIIFQYIIGVILLAILLFNILRLWEADLSVPFGYSGDFLSASTMIKTVVDHGWYIINPSLGAPFYLNMNDYPLGGDNLNFLIIKGLSLFTNDFAIVTNFFYLLTFFLAFTSSFFVLYHLRVYYYFNIVISILFTFIPYHFYRGNGGHIFLTCYYVIPLVILVAFWIIESKVSITKFREKAFFKKNLVAIIIAMIAGSTGVYYGFFAGFIWMLAAVYAAINNKIIKPVYNGVVFSVSIVIMLVINYFPTLIHKVVNGSNIEATSRSPIESEIYGLKIDQIFMPSLGHRVGKLNEIAQRYANSAPLVNENHSVSLGIIGSLGFIILIFFLLYRKDTNDKKLSLIQSMSIVNLGATLLATVGGFGFLISVIVPSIRGYNRIIPYIAFLSLLSLFLLIEYLIEKKSFKKFKQYTVGVTAILLLVFGVFDQTNSSFIPNYQLISQQYTQDKDFFERLSNNVGHEGNIYQLPYVPYPEYPSVYKMGNYEHLKAYLHSNSLKWSFGVMKGTKEDIVIRNISELPVDEMIKSITMAGYKGIYINRDGYSDRTIEEEIRKRIRVTPIVSNDERLVFFDLNEYDKKLKSTISSEEWNYTKEKILNPIVVKYGKGVYDEEQYNHEKWRWAQKDGVITIWNTSDKIREVGIRASFKGFEDDSSQLLLSGAIENTKLILSNKANLFRQTLKLKPGKNEVKFTTTAKRISAPNDPREMYFQIRDLTITELNDEN